MVAARGAAGRLQYRRALGGDRCRAVPRLAQVSRDAKHLLLFATLVLSQLSHVSFYDRNYTQSSEENVNLLKCCEVFRDLGIPAPSLVQFKCNISV